MYGSHAGHPVAQSRAGRPEIASRWTPATRGFAIGPRAAAAARAFYRDVLRGREVWPTRRADADRSLWFLVGGTLIEVGSEVRDADAPVVLDVDDPEEVAARSWDAGYSVRVRETATGGVPISVIGPFGRRIDLAAARENP